MDKKTLLFSLLIVICISLFSNVIPTEKFSDVSLLSAETQDQLTAHKARAMVITCMDFRLIDDAVNYLNSKGYNNNYDEFILAGASLGYNQTVYSSWAETLDTHIELAEKLHHITEIIVIDHMDCGAYKIFYNKQSITEEDEIALHKENFSKFKEIIGKKYPDLTVRTILMNLKGEIIEF
jgi:carbonic anhydrase